MMMMGVLVAIVTYGLGLLIQVWAE
jgi:hypothetical protein